jgi:SAM-dependent methyltransferase
MNLRSIYYALSPNMRLLVRKVYYYPIDLWKGIANKRNKYEPKRGDIYTGSGDFITQGIHQLELLKNYVQLNPNATVLDVGSGIGRTAVALTNYLSEEGNYEGFDIVEKGVKWCLETITKDFPNFNFKYIPLHNDLYTETMGNAEKFTFPYADNTFDVVFLFSVFTHMQPEEVQNYLNEISRVLKPKGKCFSTFFIYTSDNEKILAFNNPKFTFPIERDNYRLMDAKVKSANIAFNILKIENMLLTNDLKIVNHVLGYWSNIVTINDHNDYQDIVVFVKG